MNREHRRDILEAVGLVAIVASLLFLALEIRQGNVQARAAAYQAIGIATAQWHSDLDDRLVRLFTEAHYPDALVRWTLSDWERYQRSQLSGLRMVETVLLQVEQGLLDEDALNSLGYTIEGNEAIASPGFRCIWPNLKFSVGGSLRSLIDQTLREDSVNCQVDIQSLQDQTIFGDETK